MSGLLRDKTRSHGTLPLPADTVARVVAIIAPSRLAKPSSGPFDGRSGGHLAQLSVQPIWAEHRLQPHRLRTFKHSNDPGSADKLERSSGCTSIGRPTGLMLSLDKAHHPPAPSA